MSAPGAVVPGAAGALEGPELAGRRGRYIADVLAAHDRLSLRRMPEEIEPDGLLYLAERPGGLIVLSAHSAAIPERYRLAIHAFRLTQYVRTKYFDDNAVFGRALFAEPEGSFRDEVHTLALDARTGAILRYVSLVGSPDAVPMDPRDPERAPYPCELAHGINLFDYVDFDEPLDTWEVWEIKRLVQRDAGEQVPGLFRLRTSLEVMLGFYTALGRIRPEVKVFVGDGEEGLAIRRLQRSLRDITVIEGTSPVLPDRDLMSRSYVTREVVKPFAARAPRGAQLRELVLRLTDTAAAEDLLQSFKELISSAGGPLRRVSV